MVIAVIALPVINDWSSTPRRLCEREANREMIRRAELVKELMDDAGKRSRKDGLIDPREWGRQTMPIAQGVADDRRWFENAIAVCRTLPD